MNNRVVARDTAAAAAVVAGVSVVIGATESVSHVSNISNLYIIAIAILAARRGLYAAVVASGLAFLAFDWFFIPPLHEFVVSDPSEYVALVTLLVTAIVIGQLLSVATARADQFRSLQRQTQLLYEVGQAALASSELAASFPLAVMRLKQTLGLTGSRVLVRDEGGLRQAAAAGSLPEVAEEPEWLQRVLDEGRPLGLWSQPWNNVRVLRELDPVDGDLVSTEGGRLSQVYVPLRVESRVEGVLVVGERTDGHVFSADDGQLLLALADQLALALDRLSLAEQQTRARALEESDRMKTALISSISHELKTPLAVIKASATALLGQEPVDGSSPGRELADSINRETDRLTRLVGNMLDMSRIEAGALQPNLEWVSIADVISDVLDRMEPVLAGRRVTVRLPPSLRPTPLDFVQISQVLTNLLDNAVRYSPAGAAISITADVVRDQLRASVFNEGSHIPPADLDRLFDKFHRISVTPGGTGLGLSIVRGMVEAHGGRIWAENVGRRGVVFSLTLPSPAPPEGAVVDPAADGAPAGRS
jgi:two-component system sensor histidine kinase KdpD